MNRVARAFSPMGRLCPALLVLFVALAGACSTTHYVKEADKEVYGFIVQRTPEVLGMDPNFTIDEVDVSLEGLPMVTEQEVQDFLGEAGEAEVGSCIISLEKALDIAVKNSREYQTRKESLYLQALSFTEIRQRYTPVFGGRATGTYTAQNKDVTKRSGSARLAYAAPDQIEQLGDLTGTPADLLSAYADLVESAATVSGVNAPHVAIEQERSISGTTSLNATMLMKGGAQIAIGLTSNFLRFLTGDPRVSASSALTAGIQQPLLGANRRTAAETLIQAERDLLYSLRSFTRFRKSFSIDVASAYYRVLQSRDRVRNGWLNYQSYQKDLARARAEAEAGVITKTDLGRTEEEELRSRNGWITAVQAYEDSLDRFKIRLGLPTDAKVVLDDNELEQLIARGPMPAPGFSLKDAILIAAAARLDYYNRRDRLDDAIRKLELAEDGLQPDLDLALSAGVNSKPGDRFQELDFKRYTWDLGLDLDPKLNRKGVRNRYRSALISYASAQRGFEEFEDTIKLDVREAWRALEQARISYEIQKNSVAVSERRVLELELKREIGDVNALDVIDSQNALLAARNSLSGALVDHTLANLRLWLDMGILYIKENGQWEDVTDVEQYSASNSPL